jgi:hypothetical protein
MRSIKIGQLITHLFVIVQDNTRCMVQVLKYYLEFSWRTKKKIEKYLDIGGVANVLTGHFLNKNTELYLSIPLTVRPKA